MIGVVGHPPPSFDMGVNPTVGIVARLAVIVEVGPRLVDGVQDGLKGALQVEGRVGARGRSSGTARPERPERPGLGGAVESDSAARRRGRGGMAKNRREPGGRDSARHLGGRGRRKRLGARVTSFAVSTTTGFASALSGERQGVTGGKRESRRGVRGVKRGVSNE